MNAVTQRAYVLHRRPYRETSAIVEFFTEHGGRVAVVARGVQGGQRRRLNIGALCQPLQALWVSWTGRGDLKTLVSVERAEGGIGATDERLYSLMYCNELLIRLLPYHDPYPRLFADYERLLITVAQDQDVEPALRCFELALLGELGYALELDRVAESSHALDPEGRYCYVAEQGLVAVSLEDPRPSYPGSELLAIHAGRLDSADTRRVAKQLLREALQILLGPRPLASRELFRTR